jgi:hypothetical protein
MDKNLITPVAQIVFGDHLAPELAAREDQLVKAVFGWMDNTSIEDVHENVSNIGLAVRALSAPNVLRVAEKLHARSQRAVQAVPELADSLRVLAVAERTARFFSEDNLVRLGRAFANEGDQ